MNSNNPRSRRTDLIIHDALDELLIYDKISHQAHCLNPVAACVWRTADGETPVAIIASKATEATGVPCSEALVWEALDRLDQQALLEFVPPAPAGPSRRDLLALGTAAMLVTTVLVPLPAWAQSPSLPGSGGPQAGPQGPQGLATSDR